MFQGMVWGLPILLAQGECLYISSGEAASSFPCTLHYLMLPHGLLGFRPWKACAIPFDVMSFVPVLLLRSHCWS